LVVERELHFKLVDEIHLSDVSVERPIEVLDWEKVELSLLADATDGAVILKPDALGTSQRGHVLQAKHTTLAYDWNLDINLLRFVSLDVVSVVLPHHLLVAGSLRVLEAHSKLLQVLLGSLILPLFFFNTFGDLKFPV